MGYPPEHLRRTLDSCSAYICSVEGWIFQKTTKEENGEMKEKKAQIFAQVCLQNVTVKL